MSETASYFDVHAHYDDERFEAEFPGGADGAIRRSYDNGVRGIVCSGTRYETCLSSISLSEKYPFIWATVGIHPGDIRFIPYGDEDRALREIEPLLSHPRVVAVGEIGLDYHYEGTDRERQKSFFEFQLETAMRYSLPIVVHDREAHGDTFDLLRRYPDVTGVIHCFSGSAEMARQLTDRGFYLSFGGTVTFKNAKTVKESAAVTPLDKILLETDAPYMAPTPHRGEINYSGYLPLVAEALAEIKGVTPERIAEVTFENAEKVFHIDL